MRDSEIQELTRDSHTTKDGLAALKSIQHKGSNNPDAERRTWWAPRPVIRTIEVLGNLARHDTYLFARSSRNAGSYIPSRDIARLIAFVNDDPAQRPGRGRGLGLEHIAIPKGQAINATSLRRAFSVFATTRPGAELGLGIQLGHSAWRMTTGYMSDGQQRAVRLMDDERKRVLHRDAAALLQDDRPVAGPAAHHVWGSAHRSSPVPTAPIGSPRRSRSDFIWGSPTTACGTRQPVAAAATAQSSATTCASVSTAPTPYCGQRTSA